MTKLKATYLFIVLFLIFGCLRAQTNQEGEEQQVSILNNRSQNLLNSQPDSAFQLSELALDRAEKLAFREGMAKALFNLARYHASQGMYEQAGSYFEKAKAEYAFLADTAQLALVYSELGNLFRTQQLFKEANTLYQQALAYAQVVENRHLQAKVYKDLGGLYYFLDKTEEALKALKTGLSLTDKEANPELYSAILNNLGIVYKQDGRYKEAENALRRSLHLLQEEENKSGLAVTLVNIGEIQQLNGKYAEAESLYQHGLQIAEELGLLARQLESHEHLAKLYAELKAFDLAYQHKEKVVTLTQQLYQEKAEGKLAKLSKKLELERRDLAYAQMLRSKEKKLLNQEIELSKVSGERKNILISFSLVALLAAAAFAFVLYRRHARKKHENAHLSQLKKEADLHNQTLQEVNDRLYASEQEMRNLVQAKNKIFGILSHDIRSPLFTLMGTIQLLRRDTTSLSPKELSLVTNQIDKSLQGLTGMLDNLFMWANSETGLIEFSPAYVNITELVNEQLQLLMPVAEAKDIYLMDELQDAEHLLYVDANMIRVVIRNLIANGIKFTKKGGVVRIYQQAVAEGFQLMIEDNGIGMSAEEAASLFKKGKGHTSRQGTANEKGSGLGLLISQEFIAAHQGSLAVKSEENKGTTFIVTLPVAEHQLQEELPKDQKQEQTS